MFKYILITGLTILGLILEVFLFPLLICMVFFPFVNYWIIFVIFWGIYIAFCLFSFFTIKERGSRKHET